MSKLIYCATPSRLIHRMTEIMDYVTLKGDAPLHPFQAMPYERFEGNPAVGRERSMEYCKRMVSISDEVGVFGASWGTLFEAARALDFGKPVSLHRQFDPEWEKFNKDLRAEHGYPLEKVICQQAREAFENQNITAAETDAIIATMGFPTGFALQVDAFPYGSCQFASTYLQRRIPDSKVRWGKYNATSHAMLLIDEQTIADITADQFGGPKVYVGPIVHPRSL